MYTTFILKLDKKYQEQVTSMCERKVVGKFAGTETEKWMYSRTEPIKDYLSVIKHNH